MEPSLSLDPNIVLRSSQGEALLRIESRDAGAEDRLCTLATATVGAP
jgi:hypothetical protein